MTENKDTFSKFRFWAVIGLIILGIKFTTGETTSTTIITGIVAFLLAIGIGIISFIKFYKNHSPQQDKVFSIGKSLHHELSILLFSLNSDEDKKYILNHPYTAGYIKSFVIINLKSVFDAEYEINIYEKALYDKILGKGGADLIGVKETAYKGFKSHNKTSDTYSNDFILSFRMGARDGYLEGKRWRSDNTYLPNLLTEYFTK